MCVGEKCSEAALEERAVGQGEPLGTFSATGRVAPTTTRPKAPPAQHRVTHSCAWMDSFLCVCFTFCKCISCRFLFLQFFRNRSSLSQPIVGQTLPFCMMLHWVRFLVCLFEIFGALCCYWDFSDHTSFITPSTVLLELSIPLFETLCVQAWKTHTYRFNLCCRM